MKNLKYDKRKEKKKGGTRELHFVTPQMKHDILLWECCRTEISSVKYSGMQ